MKVYSEQVSKIFIGALISSIVATIMGWIIFCGLESTSQQGYNFQAHIVLLLFGIIGIPASIGITFIYSLPLSLIIWRIAKMKVTEVSPRMIFTTLSCLISVAFYLIASQFSSEIISDRQQNKEIASAISAIFSGVALGLYYKHNKTNSKDSFR